MAKQKILLKKRATIPVRVSFICLKMYQTRTFLNRMLQFLRSMEGNSTTRLTVEFFKDLKWFATFLKQFNGVVYYDVKPVQAELHL